MYFKSLDRESVICTVKIERNKTATFHVEILQKSQLNSVRFVSKSDILLICTQMAEMKKTAVRRFFLCPNRVSTVNTGGCGVSRLSIRGSSTRVLGSVTLTGKRRKDMLKQQDMIEPLDGCLMNQRYRTGDGRRDSRRIIYLSRQALPVQY